MNDWRKSAQYGLWVAFLCVPALARADETLLALGQQFDAAAVEARNVKITPNAAGLRAELNGSGEQARLVVKAPGAGWDLGKYQDVTVDVRNVGPQPVTVVGSVATVGFDGAAGNARGQVTVAPGEKQRLRVFLSRRVSRELRAQMSGMRGVPTIAWLPGVNPCRVTQFAIFLDPPGNAVLELSDFRARESYDAAATVPDDKFFPMIDTFGQYIYKDWPGKLHSAAEFAQIKQAEAADLAAHPGCADWDQYGGWKNGPQLKATGRFRTEKHQGRWWFVDPEGHLFWSHCIDWVGPDAGATVITGREKWFADLPGRDSPLAQFYRQEGGGFYEPGSQGDPKKAVTFNFTQADLYRKYGKEWLHEYAESALRRLRSWHINAAAGGAAEVCRTHRVVHTGQIMLPGKVIPTSEGFWGKFVDVFADSFQTDTQRTLKAALAGAARDPWCLGYFIDNELGWGTEASLPLAVLRAPAAQPAKHVFVADLKKKYTSIEKLNEVWGTRHASWDALLQATAAPSQRRARADLSAFAQRFAEQYFRVIHDAFKAAAPDLLYLGCRFSRYNDAACRAAAKYCDVVSFNHYQRSPDNVSLPADCDAPILISEFHFGALDRGLFHTGLVGLANQQERAATYKSYVNVALDNPAMVGTHWFMYGDEATTGFGNQENYQLGFVDVCDTPYPEIIAAARDVGAHMYQRRGGQ